MKKLFSAADSYIARMNWKDMALVKLCLCAAGIMLARGVYYTPFFCRQGIIVYAQSDNSFPR